MTMKIFKMIFRFVFLQPTEMNPPACGFISVDDFTNTAIPCRCTTPFRINPSSGSGTSKQVNLRI